MKRNSSTPRLDSYSLQKQKNMTSKKMYRITLLQDSNSLAETLAILAAKSNGLDTPYPLLDLQGVAKGQILLYPSSNENSTCEIIGENTLHLDRKIGNDYKTVLILEEIEVMEIEAPTLSKYDAQTILSGIANENIN